MDVKGTVGFEETVVVVVAEFGVLLLDGDVAVAVGLATPEEPVVVPVLPHATSRNASAIQDNSGSHAICIVFLDNLFGCVLSDMLVFPSLVSH